MYCKYIKRTFDILCAIIGLVLLSPFFLLIAVAIKSDSEGPVLYAQNRLGLNGRVFRICKFRTMVVGAEYIGAKDGVEANDPRVTRVGKLLRATSLDELPQLLNVLVGDMSLIGPRPAPDYHLDLYHGEQARRLTVRPGMGGWAQVNGRGALPWSRRIEMDLWYIDHMSPWLDMLIMWRTIKVVFSRSGYCEEQLASEIEDFHNR